MRQSADSSQTVFVFSALNAEAAPLLRAWHLKKEVGDHPYMLYRSHKRVLVISGIGKVSMAGAVAYAMAYFQPVSPVLVNIGIAGHGDACLGGCYLANAIADADTGKIFYPQLPFEAPCETKSVVTCSKPSHAYDADCLYDMEASGFYELAMKFTTAELGHCLKIVSDNRQIPWQAIDRSNVECWISDKVSLVEDIIDKLCRLRTLGIKPFPERLFLDLLASYHFSVTNAVRLRALLTKWSALTEGCGTFQPESKFSTANALLDWIEAHLEKKPFSL